MLSNTAKLVTGREAGNNGVVAHDAMATEGAIVREDTMVAHLAVMCHVRVGEKQVVVTDPGGGLLHGASVNGGVFAEGIVIPDDQGSGFAGVFEVLGELPYGREGKKGVGLANGCMPLDDHVRFEDTSFADADMSTNHRIGPDLNTISNIC